MAKVIYYNLLMLIFILIYKFENTFRYMFFSAHFKLYVKIISLKTKD